VQLVAAVVVATGAVLALTSLPRGHDRRRRSA
jgi:hypothetical protein